MRRWFGLLVVLAALSGPIRAANATEAEFVMRIRGVQAATVVIRGEDDASRYWVRSEINNSGLIGSLRKIRYRGDASGQMVDGQFRPTRYGEIMQSGRRSSDVLINYRDGTPQVIRYSSSRPAGANAPDAASQTDSVDPLTAMYAVLRDVAPAQACNAKIEMFDGKRTGRITLTLARRAAGLPVCRGRYQRLLGFTAKELERHTEFNFEVRYRPGQNGRIEVAQVSFRSVYGVATLDRR